MKIEPVRYNRLIMQLMRPTPMNALRQARSASPSSERRTPGATAIDAVLFLNGFELRFEIERLRIRCLLPLFLTSVYLSRVNPERGGDIAAAANSDGGTQWRLKQALCQWNGTHFTKSCGRSRGVPSEGNGQRRVGGPAWQTRWRP